MIWQPKNFDTFFFPITVGAAATFIQRRLVRHNGTLRTTKYLAQSLKRVFATHYARRERAEIAIMVANQYPGGDYFEFGSEGFYTFCNFLSAFDLNGHTKASQTLNSRPSTCSANRGPTLR